MTVISHVLHLPLSRSIWLNTVICYMIQEEKKYEEVEKEYETVAELAKEEEVELR